jgi:hypothetical protein
MASNFFKEKSRSLLNKDFASARQGLIDFSQAHRSGALGDTSTPSPAMAIIELQAYAVDLLSFYFDQQFNELKEETARQIENVVAFAKSKGYKPTGKWAARGREAWLIEVPSTVDSQGNVVPDPLYVPVLEKGSRCATRDGVQFETLEDIDFSDDVGLDVTGSAFDSSGFPTHFVMRKFAEIIQGETRVETFPIQEYRKFRTIELSSPDVVEVVSVTDSEGNEWLEVDYLAQDWVIDSQTNEGDDSEDVPFVMKLVAAPRRFVSDWDPVTGKTSLIFGSGDGLGFDDELVPNVADYSLPLVGRRTFSSRPIDPRNFLRTRSLGLSPYDTTLTVNYRTGGGSRGNVTRKGVIDQAVQADFSFPTNNIDVLKKGAVESSVQCLNTEFTEGGRDGETIQEIKLNSDAFFAAQARLVTREDFVARVLSMPAKFGKPDKVFVKKVSDSPSVDIHVLTRNSDGNLALAGNTLKRNVSTYLSRYRMLTDGVNILDGQIINFALRFGVVTAPKFNKNDVLVRCIERMMEYFDVDVMQIGQPIVRSDVTAELQSVQGVVSVYELTFSNVFGERGGLSYSSTRFDFTAATENGIVYCPDGSIFELKFPRKDIIGVAK